MLVVTSSIPPAAAFPDPCTGGIASAKYASYVKHVLAKLVKETPRVPGTSYPRKLPGCVHGVATCNDPSDVAGCKSCLKDVKDLLTEQCSQRHGGRYERVGECGMIFDLRAA
ncbi:hypothetical protein LINPERPRIM_LOCUS19162 [Linum perenne]